MRPTGYVNAAWQTGTCRIRLALRSRSNLQRGARMGELLPAEVGYPALIDGGTHVAMQWVPL